MASVQQFGRISSRGPRGQRVPRRDGYATLYFLAFMFVTVPSLLMALNIWRITEAKVAQQRMTDAAAHAAAHALTDEIASASNLTSPLLYGDPAEIQNLCLKHATFEAQSYAAKNWVDGKPLALDTSAPMKDVKFGAFDFNAANPVFTPINPATANARERRAINAVRVEAFRTTARSNAMPLFGPSWVGFGSAQIVTRTTAVLDRRVIGFRINDPLTPTTFQTIPLAPIALRSESVNPKAGPPCDARTWEHGVERDADPSDDSVNPVNLRNMIVRIPTSSTKTSDDANARLLDIGAGSVAAMSNQLLTGITKPQMDAYTAGRPQGLILDPTTYSVPVPELSPMDAPGGDFDTLLAALQALRDRQIERAWPLYRGQIHKDDVIVTGFVAARVIAVSTHKDNEHPFIKIELQPTLLETPTALTDYSTRFMKATTPATANSGPPSPYAGFSRLINPYICRLRMVD
jgi:hypothetical protein